jgi:hypothetical protein
MKIRIVMLSILALVATSTAAAAPLRGSADGETTRQGDDDRYVSARIIRYQILSDGQISLILNRGANVGIDAGSKGVLLRGDSSRALTDRNGTTVRFVVTRVRERQADAVIVDGEVILDTVRTNLRTSVRLRK